MLLSEMKNNGLYSFLPYLHSTHFTPSNGWWVRTIGIIEIPTSTGGLNEKEKKHN